eukprot:6150780-Alexandrium_andersonii.AAC.1
MGPRVPATSPRARSGQEPDGPRTCAVEPRSQAMPRADWALRAGAQAVSYTHLRAHETSAHL